MGFLWVLWELCLVRRVVDYHPSAEELLPEMQILSGPNFSGSVSTFALTYSFSQMLTSALIPLSLMRNKKTTGKKHKRKNKYLLH